MKNNTTNKQFNAFIARNYDGLSAHTLFQTLSKFLHEECMEEESYAEKRAYECIYGSIFRIFTGNYDAEDILISEDIASIIFKEPYLAYKIASFKRELKETKYCMEFGYIPNNLSYLKENALDMFLKNVISLCEFEFIMKA